MTNIILNADFHKSNADMRRFIKRDICDHPCEIGEDLRSNLFYPKR